MEQTMRRQEQLPGAGDATAKAQLGQSPIKRGGIVRSDEEIFLVHGFGLERPGTVPLKPELLLHHKSVLHKVMRDNAADLFAGLALFSIGGVDQIPADAAVLAVGGGDTKGSRERAYMPMPDDAQDWYRSILDDDGVVRNSVARIEDGVLHIEQGPLVGQEARVKKIDRHKRWCLVDVGEGDSAFRELLPLDVPSKT